MRNIVRLNTILTALILFISTSVICQEIGPGLFGIDTDSGQIPVGLSPGETAPGFTGYDQSGKQIDFSKFIEDGPVVLFFYRGKWCPECNKYLHDYQDSLSLLTNLGIRIMAITPESIENVEQTVRMHNLEYTVIYDCQEKIMQDYRVIFNVTAAYQDKVSSLYSVDISRHNGRDIAHLPVTATYIINRYGIITSVYFNPDFRTRASVKWILQNLAAVL